MTTVLGWLFRVSNAKQSMRSDLRALPCTAEFTAPELRASLVPYFEVTLAVRSGDLHEFR